MLTQLIYVSVRKKNCTEDEIQKILASSNKNNGALNLTGVLLYTENKFLQVLEGEQKVVLSLYDNIKNDDRHKNVMMISMHPIQDRDFPSWEMGSKKINEKDYTFLTDISKEDQENFKQLLNGDASKNSVKVISKLFNAKPSSITS